MYQIGSVELEIVPGSPGLGYKNLETADAGTASLDEIEHELGEDVAVPILAIDHPHLQLTIEKIS